jgi:hypothetical protein
MDPRPHRIRIEYFGDRVIVDNTARWFTCSFDSPFRIERFKFFQLVNIPQLRKVLDENGALEAVVTDFVRVYSESRNDAFDMWSEEKRMRHLRPRL